MKTLIIYVHPNKNSFNHALLEKTKDTLLKAGHEVQVRDLYEISFNPVLSAKDLETIKAGQVPQDIQEEQKLVLWANHLVFIYPIWWIGPPALLKGWVDRVFMNGFAFSYSSGSAQGLLKHKKALALCTAGSSKEEIKSMGMLEMIAQPMTHGTLKYCGIPDSEELVFYNVSGVGAAGRANMLARLEERLQNWK